MLSKVGSIAITSPNLSRFESSEDVNVAIALILSESEPTSISSKNNPWLCVIFSFSLLMS